jgi:hypothetical protein
MKAKVGLWIDHRKTIVAALTDKGEETGLVKVRATWVPMNHNRYWQTIAD